MFLTNHLISNLISKINYGVQKRLRFLNIDKNETTLKLLRILYVNGVIRSYRILNEDKVSIYFKYFTCNKAFKISVVSTPGNRVY
jgi:ribosomal protein S8|tara:strand:- start:193 stop:447 length:255 start_codon:yes stop_codon:yes gene_type:complete